MLAASTLPSGGSSRTHDMHFQSHLQDYRQPMTSGGVPDMGGVAGVGGGGGVPSSYQGRYPGYVPHPAFAPTAAYGYVAESGPSNGSSYLNVTQRPAPPSSFMHYNSLYNAHYMGGSSAAPGGLYGQRARYLPYQPHPAHPAHPHQHYTHANQQAHAPPPPPHRLREMFTPAGQQLIPTSVLHYPPRHNPYQQQQSQQQQQQHYYTQQLQYRQQQQQQQQQELQQQQQSLYHSHLYEPPSTASLYGQQRQQQQHSFHAIHQPSYAAAPNDYYNAAPYTPHDPGRTSSFYRPTSPLAALRLAAGTPAPHDTAHEKDKDSLSTDNNERDRLTGAGSSNSTDCLTTSPPLISATGTDSGISSCSMRARSDDSTRSTPVYNNEYPLSVGSSSGVSYNCSAEGKDYDENNRERVDAEAPKSTECNDAQQHEMKPVKVEYGETDGEVTDTDTDTVKVKTEPIEANDPECVAKISTNDIEHNVPCAEAASTVVDAENELQTQAINKAAGNAAAFHSQRPQQQQQQQQEQEQIQPEQQQEQKQQMNDSKPVTDKMTGKEAFTVTPVTTTNSSLTSERCTTPFPNTQILHASQAQQQQHQQPQSQPTHPQQQQPYASPQMQAIKSFPSRNINNNNNNYNNNNSSIDSSWYPYPSSPSCWLQQTHNAKYKRQQVWSPPPVPVPPHNSPVGYSYPACATPVGQSTTAPIVSTSVTTKKQRVIECDLIPSKKSKRKPNNATSSAAATTNATTTTTTTTKTPITNADEDEEEAKEIRDMMPLPGFQQAFGSTEIGRFSETFLRTPPHDNAPTEEAYFDDYYNAEPAAAYMMPPQHALPTWPPTPYDSYDYEGRNAAAATAAAAGSARGVGKFNLHFDARSAYAMRDYLAYERYNYGYGRGGRASFNEIRCNGY